MGYVLLSYTINEHTPLYGDTPKPRIAPHSRISNGDSSNTAIISIHNHTGTHIDAPKHFTDDGRAISDYSVDELTFTNPVIIDCPKDGAVLITPDDFQDVTHLLQRSDCLLLHTGFGRFRDEERYRTHNPGIAPETMLWIRREYPNIRCIGIDTISVSSFQYRQKGREAHKAAFTDTNDLGDPLLLVEDMNLHAALNLKLKKIVISPWQIKNIDSAPCTVLAEVI